MKIVYSNIIPFKGFMAINLFGTLFVRSEYKDTFSENASASKKKYAAEVINHESIHTAQMKEMLYLGFYLVYFIEWLIRLFIPSTKSAYYNISFEQEAFSNEKNLKYLSSRKSYAWVSYLGKTYKSKNNVRH